MAARLAAAFAAAASALTAAAAASRLRLRAGLAGRRRLGRGSPSASVAALGRGIVARGRVAHRSVSLSAQAPDAPPSSDEASSATSAPSAILRGTHGSRSTVTRVRPIAVVSRSRRHIRREAEDHGRARSGSSPWQLLVIGVGATALGASAPSPVTGRPGHRRRDADRHPHPDRDARADRHGLPDAAARPPTPLPTPVLVPAPLTGRARDARRSPPATRSRS